MDRLKLGAFKAKSPPQIEDKEFHLSKSSAFAALQMALNVFKEVAGKTGVPGLQDGVKALVIIFDALQKTSQNADDVKSFANRVGQLTDILEKVTTRDARLSKPMVDRVDRLSKTWISSAEQVQDIGSKNYVKRLVNHDQDARAIAGHLSAITWSIDTFMVESLLAIEFALDDTAISIKGSAKRIEGKLDNVQRDIKVIKMKQDVYGGLVPPHAINARFDCNDKLKPCLEGTRADILTRIHKWIDIGDVLGANDIPDADSMQTARVFWINGPGSAGTGKSTIVYTIAQDLDKQQKLGASFFCSEDDADCSNPKLIFPTIAYGLGQFYPPFQQEVSAILKADPDVAYTIPSCQIEKLLVKPLQALKDKMPFCVVVIDALDECQDGGATTAVLSSLAQYATDLSPIKFLIASRPEIHILNVFKLAGLSQTTQRCILHCVEPKVVESDIQLYLRSSLQAVTQTYELDSSWPSVEEVDALVKLSSGLFIFAATAAKFIQDRHYGNPKHQLASLLGAIKVLDSSPYGCLDQLYLQVLQNAFPSMSPELSCRLKKILGSIVSLCSPLSPYDLEQLLGLTIPLHITIAPLQSVVIIPQNDRDVIYLLHPSFHEFLIDPQRCLNHNFLVKPEMQHTLLAQACLDTMKLLTPNICKLEQPWKLHNELENLPELVNQHIPQFLQYACRHWSQHLAYGLLSDKLLDALEEFCSNHLLHWVEACSLLGDLHGAVVALKTVDDCLPISIKHIHSHSSILLHDCWRFIREFFPLISAASSQMYVSTPAFIPKDTKLLKTYHHEFKTDVKLLYRRQKSQVWNACLQTIEGHTGAVMVAKFSPDKDRYYIASASADHTVQLWDAATGIHIKTLEGHSDTVSCVAFSFDGKYLVSGSYDMTIKEWDVLTGKLLYTMNGHKNMVTSVAFTPSGSYIISASFDGTLRLWKPWEPICLYTEEHIKLRCGEGLNAMCIAPDSIHVVSATNENIIQLWNIETRQKLHKFKGHTAPALSLEFSNSGIYLISGSWDCTVCLWDVKTGGQLKQFKGHLAQVTRVSFSSDSTYIVSASTDKTIQLWDRRSGEHKKTFSGHAHEVYSVAFSPDNAQIVSTSLDNTIKIWDARVDTHQSVSKYNNAIQKLCVSPNGVYIVSVLSNHSMEIWDIFAAALQGTLQGYSAQICSVAFSKNNLQLASGSTDNLIRIWDIKSCSCIQVLKGHTDAVESVKFLLNGLQIISGSSDKTVKLWDVLTGEHLIIFEEHSNKINCVAVSSDGLYAASASEDTDVRIWDLESRQHFKVLHGHKAAVYTVTFSPTNQVIASASCDAQIRLWDINNSATLHVLHFDYVDNTDHISFSHDQKYVSIGSSCLKTDLELSPEMSDISDPIDMQQFPAYYMNNGWVLSMNTQHHICWIPQADRGLLVSTVNGIVLGSPSGIIILDLTKSLPSQVL